MYNRYIPQSDGSFRRNQMPDASPEPARPRQNTPRQEAPSRPSQPEASPCPPPRQPMQKNRGQRQQQSSQQCRQQPAAVSPPSPRDTSAAGFLRQLLPKDLDTGDLLIIVLLLLMAGDCQEDKNTMLLTLALYLFM